MQILTVVTGIVFVLLLLSLLATTLMELISSFFSLRGRNLIKALRNMLASSDENELLLTDFKQNSLYRHLTEQYGRKNRAEAPSYMAAETFQSILFDVILKGDSMDNLENKIDALPDEDLKNVLKQLMRESGGQLDLFRLEVQNWYDNVMDRAGGWYKRYTQKILIFLGLGIAVLFNADTVAMYERLSSNPEQLAQVVALAENYVQARENVVPIQANTGPVVPQGLPGGAPQGFDTIAATAPVTLPARTRITPDDPRYAEIQAKLDEVKYIVNFELESVRSPLGLGWEGTDVSTFTIYDAITKLLGFILTALAVSMGAPFWFDLLRKLVNVRSSGNKP
jgi:hypothetical protein